MAAIYTVDQALQKDDYYSAVIRAVKYENTIQALLKRGPKPEQWKQEIEVEGATPAYDLSAAEGGDFDESGLAARTNAVLEVQLQKFRSKRGYMVTDETKLLPGYTEAKGEKALARAQRRDAEEVVRSIELALGSTQEAVARGSASNVVPKTRGMMSWLAMGTHSVQAIPSAVKPTVHIDTKVTDSTIFTENKFKEALLAAALTIGDGHLSLTGLCGLKLKAAMSEWLGKATATNGLDTVLRRSEPKSKKIELICDEFAYDAVTVRTLVCNSLNVTFNGSNAVTLTDANLCAGAFIRPEFWTIDTLLPLTNRTLENKGGGERGYHEAILRLACRNPLGQFSITHNANAQSTTITTDGLTAEERAALG